MRQIEDKKVLRSHFKKLRRDMTDLQRANADKAVFNNFVCLEEFQNCKKLLIYISSSIEVDTSAIIREAFKREIEVYCPRCVKGTNEMIFYKINAKSDIERGAYDILEPKKYCAAVQGLEGALCVVPALSIDKSGVRLGFGMGYYDRFLGNNKILSAGLCYENCLSNQLPVREFDVKVDILVTDGRTERF